MSDLDRVLSGLDASRRVAWAHYYAEHDRLQKLEGRQHEREDPEYIDDMAKKAATAEIGGRAQQLIGMMLAWHALKLRSNNIRADLRGVAEGTDAYHALFLTLLNVDTAAADMWRCVEQLMGESDAP